MTPFNIGTRIELSDFSQEEAYDTLAQGFASDPTSKARVIDRILYWTGGHPYLTQRLCQEVANAGVPGPIDVDRICDKLFLASNARGKDDNLLFVRERILRSDVDRASLLDLYLKVRTNRTVRADESNHLANILRLSGITRVISQTLLVRNRIYHRVFDRKWVKENLPEAELQRQRRGISSRRATNGHHSGHAAGVSVRSCLLGFERSSCGKGGGENRGSKIRTSDHRVGESAGGCEYIPNDVSSKIAPATAQRGR